jgi:hypothetical protein
MANVLEELVALLNSGALRVIDLTQPLSAETPLLPLPPQRPNTPQFRLWEISRYDDRGPAWYWSHFVPAKSEGATLLHVQISRTREPGTALKTSFRNAAIRSGPGLRIKKWSPLNILNLQAAEVCSFHAR